jgi:hypothetical protein
MNQESDRSMKKIGGQKIPCYCPYKASFWFPEKQTVLKIYLVVFETILSGGNGTRK